MVALGEEIGRVAGAGTVISLEGPLGAGKTHLTKGVAAGAGYAGAVSSPTFTLVHEYVGGRVPVFHFDFYRLEAIADLEALAWRDYLDGTGIVLAEWGDRFPDAFPAGTLRVRIALAGTGRVVTVEELA